MKTFADKTTTQFSIFEEPIAYSRLIGESSSVWKAELLVNYCTDPRVAVIFDELVPAGLAYNVFDTTCHIMQELTGVEQNNIFPAAHLANLAKLAYEKSKKELGHIDDISDAYAAHALWNLLLPEKEGGIYPDAMYDAFITNLVTVLQNYKLGNDKLTFAPMLFPAAILIESFKNFKELALRYYQLDPRPENFAELSYS